jgi:hypothetical protein
MRHRRRPLLLAEELERRTLLSGVPSSGVVPLTFTADQAVVQRPLSPDATFYSFTVTRDTLLTAHLAAQVGDTRLSLLTADGTVLVQSDGVAPGDRDDHIDLQLPGSPSGTTYYLRLEALGNAASGLLSVTLGPGDSTFLNPRTETGSSPVCVLAGDLNGDGRTDLVSVNARSGDAMVLLGRGDGTFLPLVRYSNGADPVAGTLADLNGDGILDLVLVNGTTNSITVSRGRGDGTFAAPASFATTGVAAGVVAGDFNGDGRVDLVTADVGSNTLTLFANDGQGSLLPGRALAVGDGPVSVVQGDFNGDGVPDLACANSRAGTISVLFGTGGGQFAPPITLDAGSQPTCLVSGDFNGDGLTDLAVTNGGTGTVSVFLARPGGFAARAVFQAGADAYGLTAGHFGPGGTLDLAVSDRAGNSIRLLLGDGNGGFVPGPSLPAGSTPMLPVTADFDRDGLDDIAVANLTSSDVSVFLGNAPSRPIRTAIANAVVDGTLGDFNADGFLDGVGADPFDGCVYLLYGGGRVTIAPIGAIGLDGGPSAVAIGDFNGDGRLDFAVTTMLDDHVTIFEGLGDGTFNRAGSYSVGDRPLAVAIGDFNGDGKLDLATANDASGDVSILLGRGDGTFLPEQRWHTGAGARALAVADLNGDGRVDLVCGNELDHSVSILFGRAGGGFSVTTPGLPSGPRAVAVVDVNGDGRRDILVASQAAGTVQVLVNRGGTFTPGQLLDVGGAPVGLSVNDVNRDGHPDIAVARNNANDIVVLLGGSDGTLQIGAHVPVGSYPTALVARDLTNDGRPDLLNVNALGQSLSLNVGNGDGTFTDQASAIYPTLTTPILADFNHDGVPDVVVLQRSGTILARLGIEGGGFLFAPPVVLNPDAQDSARDLAVVHVAGEPVLAAADARSDSLSLYSWNAGSRGFVRRARLQVPAMMPVRVLAGDVNGDGRDDLIATTESGQLFVWLQSADGTFAGPAYQAAVGVAPGDLTFVRQPGTDRPAIAVLDSVSGDVRVLVNWPDAPFAEQLRYRAGTAEAGLVTYLGRQYVSSRDNSVALVSGDLNGDGQTDLIVVNQDARQLASLLGTGEGFLNAATPSSLQTGSQPVAIVAGDFNGDGVTDLVVLDGTDATLRVYLGDGHGGFTPTPTSVSAGNAPSGLTVADVNGDGKLDLLVGNSAGDVLALLGNGDGTFQPYRRIDQRMTLAVGDLSGAGHEDFVIANQAMDRVTVQDSQSSSSSFTQDRGDGIRDPGQVKLADLNGDGIPDLIVVNGGGNNVLVYPGLPGGQFGPARSFFAGTNPAGVTVSDLNGDGRRDLVIANEGSNDVSILLGSGEGSGWTLTPGPRLGVGAGPVATLVRDVNGDGVPDLLVCNGGDGTVSLLHGVGGGFFDDRHPVVFHAGADPTELAVGEFDGRPGLDLVTLDRGSDEVSLFSGMGTDRRVLHVGHDPVAMLTGDFNHDGYGDLVIVNHGDDTLSLLDGGSGGLHVAATLSAAALVHPGDIALAGAGVGSLEVYVLLDNQEVTRLTFVLEAGEVRLGGERLPAPGQQVSDFSSLGASLLEGVTTLLLENGATGEGAESGRLVPASGEAESSSRPMPASGGGDGWLDEEQAGDGSFARAAGLAELGASRSGASGEAVEPSRVERDLNAFVLGLDQLPFERRLQDGLAREREATPPPVEAIDELFRAWRAPESAPPATQGEGNALDASVQARSTSEGLFPRSRFWLGQAVPDGAPAEVHEGDKEEASQAFSFFLLNPSSLVLFAAPYAVALAAEERPRLRRMTA